MSLVFRTHLAEGCRIQVTASTLLLRWWSNPWQPLALAELAPRDRRRLASREATRGRARGSGPRRRGRHLEDHHRQGQLALGVITVPQDEAEVGLPAIGDLPHAVRVNRNGRRDL